MNERAIFYAAYLEGFSKRVRANNYDEDAPYDANALEAAAKVMRDLMKIVTDEKDADEEIEPWDTCKVEDET